jgi:hypothetical protein
MFLLSEEYVVGSGVSDDSRFGVNAIYEGVNVRESAKNLGVGFDEVVIQVLKKLVGAPSTNDRQYPVDIGVFKSVMDILNSRFNR